MLASDIIDRVSKLLQDEDHTRWPEAELLMWTGDALLQIASIRPDAHVTEAPMPLVAGADQTVPETITVGTGPDEKTYTVVALLDVKHNVKADGKPGKAPSFADHNALSRFDKLWKARAKKAEIDNWLHDNRYPKRFMCQPANNGDGLIMCEFRTVPLRPSTTASELDLHNKWRDAIVAYVMFRAYSKDAEHSPLAGQYATMFAQLVGADSQISRAYSPQIAEAGGAPNMNLLGQGGV